MEATMNDATINTDDPVDIYSHVREQRRMP